MILPTQKITTKCGWYAKVIKMVVSPSGDILYDVLLSDGSIKRINYKEIISVVEMSEDEILKFSLT